MKAKAVRSRVNNRNIIAKQMSDEIQDIVESGIIDGEIFGKYSRKSFGEELDGQQVTDVVESFVKYAVKLMWEAKALTDDRDKTGKPLPKARQEINFAEADRLSEESLHLVEIMLDLVRRAARTVAN